jgi:hypothetical protein
MFEAQRAGADRLYLNNDPELENGLYFNELTRRLAKHRFDRWVDWLPFPNVAPTERDDQLGNRLFLAALGWIARHELAHIALHHHAQLDAKSITRYNAEIEADKQGSQWACYHALTSMIRSIAGLAGFLTLIQLLTRPLRYGRSRRLGR